MSQSETSRRNIALVDLSAQHAELRAEIDLALARLIDSGRFILGPEVEAFETELASASDASETELAAASDSTFAVGVSSGTDALLLALMALGVGPGDEVVTTPFSFFATAGVIARLQAVPVFADIEASSFNLDPQAAAAAVTSKTRAILPVNLYGRLASLPETAVPIVEDAAQSIGCGRPRGIAACYSFFPTKNIGAMGDAGAVLTSDADYADRLRLLRTHGGRPKYYHASIGGNFRLDAMQAAILRVKLKRLDAWNQARRQNAAVYRALLANCSDVTLPEDSPEHVYHQFTIRCPRRDELRDHLREACVASEIYYPVPLHLQACFAELGYKEGRLPEAETAARESLSLPIHPHLAETELVYVAETISGFYGSTS